MKWKKYGWTDMVHFAVVRDELEIEPVAAKPFIYCRIYIVRYYCLAFLIRARNHLKVRLFSSRAEEEEIYYQLVLNKTMNESQFYYFLPSGKYNMRTREKNYNQ